MNIFVHVFNCTYILKVRVLLIRQEGEEENNNCGDGNRHVLKGYYMPGITGSN